MKKLLLSSIIMFGICGYVTAQNATDSKFKKAETKTNSISPATPQKAAVITDDKSTNDLNTTPASDKVASEKPVSVKVAKPAEAKTVNAAGEVINADVQKKKELEKAKTARDIKGN